MEIQITRTGNRSLYQSLYSDIDLTTRHRTFTGAARSILKMSREAARLSQTVGKWGTIAITINGNTLSNRDAINLLVDADDAIIDRRWKCPVSVMAEKIEEHA